MTFSRGDSFFTSNNSTLEAILPELFPTIMSSGRASSGDYRYLGVPEDFR